MTTLSFEKPPASLCLLRLSAIGDVTHLLPIVATLQQQWPETRITWIIGRIEYQLVKNLTGIEFIVFDKRNGFAEYLKLRQSLANRKFDVLLMMQVALRANLISLLINAKYKIGYDSARARDFHGLFCKHHIQGPDRVHVLDSFFQFIEKLGIQQRNMNWLLKSDSTSTAYAKDIIQQQTTVIINPCSSARANNFRNWSESSYAHIVDHLSNKGIKVILTGGPDSAEIEFAQHIVEQCQQPPVNLVGKTSLMQLLALLEQGRCLIAPDTGPAHMGTVAGIPVIGLYASSNPLRTGPYNSQQYLVNAYPTALEKYNHKTVEQARWGERVRSPEVMQMISEQSVITALEQILEQDSLIP